MKRRSASLVTREMQIKATRGVTSHLLGAYDKKGKQVGSSEDVGRGDHVRCWWGRELVQLRWEQHGVSSLEN